MIALDYCDGRVFMVLVFFFFFKVPAHRTQASSDLMLHLANPFTMEELYEVIFVYRVSDALFYFSDKNYFSIRYRLLIICK